MSYRNLERALAIAPTATLAVERRAWPSADPGGWALRWTAEIIWRNADGSTNVRSCPAETVAEALEYLDVELARSPRLPQAEIDELSELLAGDPWAAP